ncbi:ester cyclase [Candidatus Bipolaricaulota bacterium]|nr:ester cyclase [Candidatus Bipolaricaulota bacterium]
MIRVLSVLLLAVFAAGVMGCADTAVSPRTPEGALVFDNDTGSAVTGLGILFDRALSIEVGDVVPIGGDLATSVTIAGRSVWIDIEMKSQGSAAITLGEDGLGAQVVSAYWVSSEQEKNKVVARWIIEAVWNEGDLGSIGAFVSPTFLFHNVSMIGDIPGVEGYSMFVAGSRGGFPDATFTIEDVVAERDLVALRVTRTGTHTGDLMGIPPTGAAVTEKSIVIYRFSDGKAAEGWMQYDALGLLVQLGLIPPMGPPSFTWGAPSEITGDPGIPDTNKIIAARDPLEIWNEANLALVDDVIGEGFVGHYETTTVAGREAYRQYVPGTLAAFPDFRITVEELIAEGDLVVFRSTASGTHLGPLGPIPATGLPWTVSGMVIRRIADGQVVETWQMNDMLSLLTQIGVIPPLQ